MHRGTSAARGDQVSDRIDELLIAMRAQVESLNALATAIGQQAEIVGRMVEVLAVEEVDDEAAIPGDEPVVGYYLDGTPIR